MLQYICADLISVEQGTSSNSGSSVSDTRTVSPVSTIHIEHFVIQIIKGIGAGDGG